MKVVIQTRFSYVGKSGWKSKAAANPELLFDKERMEARFHYFEHIALASLRAQTDDDFKFHILSSNLMPAEYRTRLIDLVGGTLGMERCLIRFEPSAKAGNYFRKYAWQEYSADEPMAQSVLDDDDGLAIDFVKNCRMTSQKAVNMMTEDSKGYQILSYPRGYQYFPNAPESAQFSQHFERWINLGLTWVSTKKPMKNVLLTKHKVVNRHHPVATCFGRTPMYVRTIHNHNDSPKAENAYEKVKLLTLEQIQLNRFPYLQTLKSVQDATENLQSVG